LTFKFRRQSPAEASTNTSAAANSFGGWLPPGGYASCNQWAIDNKEALVAYAVHVAEQGTAAEQLNEFLAKMPKAI
jgi:hypothetical protein